MNLDDVLDQRRVRIGILLGLLGLYVVFLGYSAFTGSGLGIALADVFIGVVLLSAVALSLRGAMPGEQLRPLAAAGYAVAGLAIGYTGLAALGLVPAVRGVEAMGDAALLIALGAYLYQRTR